MRRQTRRKSDGVLTEVLQLKLPSDVVERVRNEAFKNREWNANVVARRLAASYAADDAKAKRRRKGASDGGHAAP